MKKILTILLLGIFLINFSSAALLDFSTWDDKVIFNEPEKIGDYGKYEINDTDFWFFNNKPIKTIELIENKYSVFTAWNIKEIEVFKPSKLFDKTNYLDKNQEGDKRDLLSSETHLYREWKIKTRIINNQSCLIYEMSKNQTQICLEWENNPYEETYEKWSEWQVYNFQEVQEGLYQTKTIVTREHQDTGTIDWVDENEGHSLDKWATWWDTDWNRKRNITNLNGTISALYNITYDANMKTDFRDLRFLDNATENIELNYTIISKVDSTSAMIRVDNLNVSVIYMYYGNPSTTTTTSNSQDVFYRPEAGYFFYEDARDFSGNGNNGTNNGADFTNAGYIDNAFDFIEANNDNINLTHIINTTTGTPFSYAMWIKPKDTGVNNKFFGQDTLVTRGFQSYVEIGTHEISFYNGLASTYTTDETVNNNEWNFVSITYNSSQNLIINVNGISKIFNSVTIQTDTTHDTYIGYDGRGDYFNGTIDEVYIYNYTLSTTQLLALAYQNIPTFVVGAEEIFGAIIKLISPEDNLATTQTFQTFRCNASFESDIANLTFILDGVDTFTNSTVGTFIDLTYSENLSQGNYKWSCKAVTIAEKITQSENRTLIVHTTPLELVIHNPEPIIDYHLLGTDLLLNWTITEGTENLTEHVKNCTYEYNGVLTVLNNTVCTQINQTNFTYILGVNNLTFNVTDEFDLVNSTTVLWNINLTEINQTYNNETLEGASEDFSAIIRLGQGKIITAVALIYNESVSAGTSSIVGDNTEMNINLVIPQVTTETNITFYWSVILTGGEIINLTSQNQTVKNMEIDNCSSFSNQILNITMVDEEDQFQLINTTLEVAINLLSVDRTQTVVSLSGNFEDQNPLGICLNENITESIMYSLDAILKYTSIGYAIEYYNIVNSSLDNETTTQSITLFNLNASDSTDFQLTFTGEDFLPVENALVFIERQYIAENTFKTVELPKTDSNGQTILHLVRNDIIYNIRVVKEGVVLANFQNIIAFCEDFTIGACSLPLNAISNISLVFNYDDEIGLIFEEKPQYNDSTKIVSFSFSSVDGTTKLVDISVERRDVFGNRTVCENTIITASGTVSCQVSQDITDTSLFTIVSVDGEEKIFSSVVIDDTAYGQNGYAMFFVFALAMLLMFSGSKTWTLIGISLNYIFGVSLGIIIGGIAGVGSTGIFVLIITIVGIWQLNKERKQ